MPDKLECGGWMDSRVLVECGRGRELTRAVIIARNAKDGEGKQDSHDNRRVMSDARGDNRSVRITLSSREVVGEVVGGARLLR